MKLKHTLLGGAFASALLVATGCGGSQTAETQDTDADKMFAELQTLTLAYCDSMEHATDSATIAGLSERYEAASAAINLKYPPFTDRSLTEGQNDTLAMLTQRFSYLRNSKAMPAAPIDSIPNDSI